MIIIKIFVIVIISILLLIFAIWFTRFRLKLKYKRAFVNQINDFKNFGYDVIIDGNKGSGKTTLMTGLSHVGELYLRSEIFNKLEEIKLLLPEFPFNEIEELFIKFLDENNDYKKSIDSVIKNLSNVDDKQNITYKYKLDYIYNDRLNNIDRLDLIIEYLNTFRQIYRNHIYSNVEIYNHITKTYSLEFKKEWLNIKEKNDFPIDEFTILLRDENSIDNSNDNAVSKLNEDTGSPDFIRLQRNGFRGHVFMYLTQQNAKRILPAERDLIDCFIHVQRSYIVGKNLLYEKYLNLNKVFVNLNYKIYSFIFKRKDKEYLDSYNYFRKKLLKFENKEKIYFSKLFVKFESAIYSNCDDVGKIITDEMQRHGNYYYNFIIPIPYCYGSVNSYCFAPVMAYLRNKSNLKSNDLQRIEIDNNFIENILMKYKEKKELKNKNSLDTNEFIFKE